MDYKERLKETEVNEFDRYVFFATPDNRDEAIELLKSTVQDLYDETKNQYFVCSRIRMLADLINFYNLNT